MVSKNEIRNALIGDFPALTLDNFEQTSDEDGVYNCIAWAAGEAFRWWWPSLIGYWPLTDLTLSLDNFQAAFETLGFSVAAGPTDPSVVECVAIYARNDVPTHAARQKIDGLWTSKLGGRWDIDHSLDALDGPQYGSPALFMQRRR